MLFTVIPELSHVIGPELTDDLLDSNEVNQQYNLKKCFTALMTASEEDIQNELLALKQRLNDMKGEYCDVIFDRNLEQSTCFGSWKRRL